MKMIRYTRDNGVSPVIAVLLILSMTVVAAGIVAVVATGMMGDLQNGKQVGLIVKSAASGGDVLVTVVPGKGVPELTKLEVLDGGSADAVFREVTFSDGGAVASFTAGGGYVAGKVAFPASGKKSYTTPIVVKGTFEDGKETVLLNTKLTFRDVVVSPLYGVLNDFFVKNYDGSVNLSLMDLFLYGIPITLTHEQFHITDNKGNAQHGLTITIPDGMLNENTFAKITISKIDNNGDGEVKVNDIGTVTNTPTLTVYTVDQGKYERVIIQLDLYEKVAYQQYQQNYKTWKNNGEQGDKPTEPNAIGSQNATITLTGNGY